MKNLRKTFPGVIFTNNNLPENRFRIFSKIDELPEDSVDIFKRNIDRYINIDQVIHFQMEHLVS